MVIAPCSKATSEAMRNTAGEESESTKDANGSIPPPFRRRHWSGIQLLYLFMGGVFLLVLQMKYVTVSTSYKTTKIRDPDQIKSNSAVPNEERAQDKKNQTDASGSSEASSRVTREKEIAPRGNTNIIAATTVEDSKSSISSTTKPTIYLHVGPPKTGTTSTQVALTLWKHKLLQQDNMEYLGFHMWPNGKWQKYDAVGHGLADTICLANARRAAKKNQKSLKCFDDMLESISNKYNNNPSEAPADLILSDEVFTRNRRFLANTENLDFLASRLQDMYNLELILTYRRMEDWYPSARRQINIRAQKIGSWKGPVEPLFPGILAWARKQSYENYPAPWELIKMFKQAKQSGKSSLKYHVYNFHNSMNLFQTLACDVLNATQACALSKLENATRVYMGDDNIEKDFLLYDEILSMAANRSIFNGERIKRRTALRETHQWFTTIRNATIKDLPMKCPPRGELEEFLTLSLAVEKATVPDFASTHGAEQAHVESFWKAVDNGKFCSVDVESVTKDSEWLRFLSSFPK